MHDSNSTKQQLQPEVTWKCTKGNCPSNKGKAELDHSLLNDVSATISEQLASVPKDRIDELEAFLEQYGAAMHPNHHCSVEASRILSQLYGNVGAGTKRSQGGDYAEAGKMSVEELKRKEEHCRKVLKVVEVLQPGELNYSLQYELDIQMISSESNILRVVT
jgi:hypothetical protein